MTLLRAAARTMLASYFVATGVKAVRNPAPLVPAAEPIADRVVPMIKKYAPEQVAGYIPEDTVTLIRVNGAAQILGGLGLATGKGRRVGALLLAGSLVPSTVAKHPFWSRSDPEEKAADKTHFLKNVSLLGGVLLASADTEGKPSLVWRAQKGGHALAKDTRKVSKKLGKKTGVTQSSLSKSTGHLADSLSKNTSQIADTALASGAALVGAAVASSRKAKKEAAKQLKVAQAKAAKQAELAREAHAKAAKQAEKDGRKKVKAAQKSARRIKKNINLGEN